MPCPFRMHVEIELLVPGGFGEQCPFVLQSSQMSNLIRVQ